MNKVKTKLLLSLAVSAMFFSSCVKENYIDGGVAINGGIDVRVSLQMPASSPKTYAISAIDENRVNEIDVLAFKADAGKPSGWAFAYSAQGTAITDVSESNPIKAKKQFTVKLIKNPAEQTFVILANAREQLEALGAIATGADKNQLLARLVYANPGSWNANNDKPENAPDKNFEPFPMWGETKETLTDATMQITGIYMVRAIARMDVVLDEDVIDADNFELNEIYIYNSKNAGRVVPNPVNLESPVKVNAASEPAGSINNTSPLIYNVPSSMKTAFERTIYIFEAQGKAENQSSQATCLVVGGTYGTDHAPTYYRLDFLKKADTDTYYRDILRNHWYRMNILSVSGSGYPTPEEAFNSKPFNMVAEIVEWDDGGMGNIVFDGQYLLKVSQDEFSFHREEKTGEEEDNVLYVYTDYTTTLGTSGWYVDKIVDADDGTTPVTWLTLTPDHGDPLDKTKVILTFGNNNSGVQRSAVVWLAAGRMRYPVKVIQELTPSIRIDIVDPADNSPLSEIIFFAPVGTQPNMQSFKVNWNPPTEDVTVVNSTLASSPFPPGVGVPASGIIPGGTGTITYDVQPPAIQASDLVSNPFFERGSKIDFMVSNGLSYESKSIFVRQVHYDLDAETEESYLLDGSTYTLRVKSNTSWRIKSIVNDAPGTILALKAGENLTVGTTGGYNVSTGDELKFTVVNDHTFWGSLHITFENTQTPKYFEDKTVTLLFALPKIKLLGFGHNSIYGYTPSFDAGSNCAYQMLNSPNNFGLNKTSSTVYSHGFEMINRNHTTSVTNQNVLDAIAKNPDIISIGYNVYITPTQAGYFNEYMKNGGVVIALCEGGGNGAENLLRAVLGSSSIDQAHIHYAGGGMVYSLPNIDDPVLNGPFGDLRGLRWGEDASYTCVVSGLPNLSDLVTYSNGNDISGNANDSRISMLRYKNLIWIGDGGFISSYDTGSHIICPFLLDADKRPISKSYGRGTHYQVYNSQLYANIVAWAISQVGTTY